MKLGTSGLETAPIALGCMRMNDLNKQEAVKVIDTSVEAGINFFDHADIYGAGTSEEVFAEALKIEYDEAGRYHSSIQMRHSPWFFRFFKETYRVQCRGDTKKTAD